MHGKDTRRIQFSLCSHKKPTNFDLRQMVCEPFVDSVSQVRSSIHAYVHLLREPFASGSQTIRRTHVYEALHSPLLHVSSVLLLCDHLCSAMPLSFCFQLL